MTAATLIFGVICTLAGMSVGWFLNEWVRALDREAARRRERRPF